MKYVTLLLIMISTMGCTSNRPVKLLIDDVPMTDTNVTDISGKYSVRNLSNSIGRNQLSSNYDLIGAIFGDEPAKDYTVGSTGVLDLQYDGDVVMTYTCGKGTVTQRFSADLIDGELQLNDIGTWGTAVLISMSYSSYVSIRLKADGTICFRREGWSIFWLTIAPILCGRTCDPDVVLVLKKYDPN